MFPSERLPSAARWTPPAPPAPPVPARDVRRPARAARTVVIDGAATADDTGLAAAVRYAVEALGAEHVVVFERSAAGAVAAPLAEAPGTGGDGTWRGRLRAAARRLAGTAAPAAAARPTVAAPNTRVYDRVRQLAHTPAVRHAWEAGRALALHGVVCDVQGPEPRVVVGGLDGPARAAAPAALPAPGCVDRAVARYGWAM